MIEKNLVKKAVVLFFILGIVLLAACAPPEKPTAPPTKPPEKKPPAAPAKPPAKPKVVYKGTVYVAGMGGHFAVAEIEIDPTDPEYPLKVKSLSRIALGPARAYGTHDPRIDYDKGLMYWSTYVNDSGYYHVGIIDLKTGEVKVDKKIKIPKEVKKKPFGCASGQTPDYYMPVFMTYPGFIDIYDKKTMELVKRLWIPDTDPFPKSYCWYHGTNSPDYKYFALAVTECTKPNDFTSATGRVLIYLLDLPSLLKGEFKVIKGPLIIKGEPMKTAVFRQYFSPDGKYLYQSGMDRFIVIDVENWKVVDEEILTAAGLPEYSENHDAMPTPDNKYVILTIRYPMVEGGKKVKDGVLVLYDVEKKKIIGKPVSVCKKCHGKAIAFGKTTALCGIEGWKQLKIVKE